ncbi:hypothetical protein NAMH_0405 [Nautilia profundicola AmH]|uniref:Periplasmic protein n=1 Tax=Nautilia profundicola (strain ATCC BAA-1463 / DSM 18972 / AmH) TaxID=598659 RepID=B9L871_NAUPA|nr:SIMPL domain-containing protein [Nautilia profundicola]ACM93635.1 hypothetical protein NAMH_0405 [Nautilia profundicola AmH]
MKKLIIFISGILFAYTLTNTKTYTQKIEPNLLKATIQVTITQKELNNLIELLNTNMNKLKTVCQNATYSFIPVYRYINKKEVFENYKAYINATCTFKSSEIKKFSNIINKLQNAKVKLNSLNLTISKKEKTAVINNLKTKAYNDILTEAAILSKKLDKKCFATNINIYTPYTTQKRSYMTKSFASMPIPKQEKSLLIKTDYKIECY